MCLSSCSQHPDFWRATAGDEAGSDATIVTVTKNEPEHSVAVCVNEGKP